MNSSSTVKKSSKTWSTSDHTIRTPDEPLPYGRQTLGHEEISAVINVLQSNFITQGPAIEAFEQAVAEYCKVPYAVAFCNGTAALHAAYFAAGLGTHDEAITTPLTFAATANAMLFLGAKPVFADICPQTWNLDPTEAETQITSRTKALVPVHFAGQPVDLEVFYRLADRHNLVVIEDACHALGATYHNHPIGQCRDMAVFSFHPVKSITTGEGGMVVTPHREIWEKLRLFRNHGITRNEEAFIHPSDGPWYYEMQDLGNNYRLTDIQAAIGTVQMKQLPQFIEKRQHLVNRYRQAFGPCPQLQLQAPLENAQSANHLFPIRITPEYAKGPETRRALYDALVEANIRPQVHYIPVHLQPYYQQHLGTQKGLFPQAESYYEQCLSLPLYPSLSEAEQDYVIARVLSFFSD